MALSVKVGSFSQPTTTGNSSVTGVGFQPKVILFFANSRTSDGSSPGAMFAFGAGVSSSDRRAGAYSSTDNNSGGQVGFSEGNTRCIRISDSTGNTLATADFVSHDSDGFTLNWANADANARVINYIAIGGTTLTNVMGGSGAMRTTTGNQSYTGVGFQPDAILFFFTHYSQSTNGGSNAGHSRFTIGYANSSSSRGYSGWLSRNGENPTVTNRVQKTNRCFGQLTTDSLLSEFDIVSFDSDGFTLNQTTASSTADSFYYVAFKGAQFKVGSFNQATSTGNQSTTGVGFQPALLMLQSINNTTSSSVLANSRNSFGAGSSSSARAAIFNGDRDNVATTITDTDLDRTSIIKMMTEGTPSTEADGDLNSLDSDGFTINWTTADGTAREILYFAIGDVAAGGAISGTSSGAATTSAALTGLGALSGAISGLGTAVGAAIAAMLASGTSDGVATATAVLTGLGALSGTSDGVATLTAVLNGLGALSGSSDGSATVTGNMINQFMSGLAEGLATASGTLTGSGALSGSSDGVATVTGRLLSEFIQGLAEGIATVTGTLTGLAPMSGTSDGVASTLGLLTGIAALAGQSSAVATADGVLVGLGSLSGLVSGSASLSALLGALAAISGTSSGLATVTGSLSIEGEIPQTIHTIAITSKPFGVIYFIPKSIGNLTVSSF